MGPLHEHIQNQINETLLSLGYTSACERKGNGWRADVYAEKGSDKFAFEVQTSPQTLKRTLERQALYLRDGIVCCWLFEKEPAKQKEELQDLPVFMVYNTENGFYVSLKGRKELPLATFIEDFVMGRIRFCKTIKPLPIVEVNLIENPCYRCGSINHIYFLSPFKSACEVQMTKEEAMWTNDKFSLDDRIVNKIKEYVSDKPYINLATIKERYSKTICSSYKSFGCADCDAIFGDFYVQEAILDCVDGEGVIETFSFPVDFDLDMRQDLPHWCHPGEKEFCE